MNVKQLYIEITNRCNLNCRSCYNRSGMNRQYLELSVKQLECIIDLFIPYGLKRVLLSGGEPTLHTEFDCILDLVDRYPDLSFGITTNGTIHHTKLIDHLHTRRNLTLQISLDGSCEEINALTRGKGQFHKTLDLARQLHIPAATSRMQLLKDPAAEMIPRFTLKMVVSKNNLADVEAFCKLALSLGFTPELAFLQCSGNAAEHWEALVLTPSQKLHVLKLTDRLNREEGTHISLPLCTDSCPYSKGLQDLSLSITPDGTILPCQMIYDRTYAVGNVHSFHSEDFLCRLDAFSQLVQKRGLLDFQCSRCLLNGHCGKGCPADALSHHHDLFASDENCDYRKLQFLYHQLNLVTTKSEDLQ